MKCQPVDLNSPLHRPLESAIDSGRSARYRCHIRSRSPSTNPIAIPSLVLRTSPVLSSSITAATNCFTPAKHASHEREENATGIASIRGVAAQTSTQAQSLSSTSNSEEPTSSMPKGAPSSSSSYKLNEKARTDAGTTVLVELINQALKSSLKVILLLMRVVFVECSASGRTGPFG